MNDKFHRERASCVGGSDLADLLQLPPYGCRRRLWYMKKGEPADFPFLGNAATERGLALEVYAARDFIREMPFDISPHAPPFRAWADVPVIGCHADRLVYERGDMPGIDPGLHEPPIGVLEIKCPSARVFYSGRGSTEPPNEAKLQAIWCAAVWRVDRAWVQWFSGDAWRSRVWEVPSDDFALFRDMRDAAVDFWHTLDMAGPPYEPLPDGDRRCAKCPWRGTCKGLGRDTDDGLAVEHGSRVPLQLAPTVPVAEADRLALTFLAARRRLADAKEAHALAKEQLEAVLPGPGVVDVPSGRIKLSESFRKGHTRTVGPSTVRLLTFKPTQPEESFDDDGITVDDE